MYLLRLLLDLSLQSALSRRPEEGVGRSQLDRLGGVTSSSSQAVFEGVSVSNNIDSVRNFQ